MKRNKNYVMLILHQVKLMTSNGFSIPLILLEKIEERYEHKLEEVLKETPVRIGMNGGGGNKNEWRNMRMNRQQLRRI